MPPDARGQTRFAFITGAVLFFGANEIATGDGGRLYHTEDLRVTVRQEIPGRSDASPAWNSNLPYDDVEAFGLASFPRSHSRTRRSAVFETLAYWVEGQSRAMAIGAPVEVVHPLAVADPKPIVRRTLLASSGWVSRARARRHRRRARRAGGGRRRAEPRRQVSRRPCAEARADIPLRS